MPLLPSLIPPAGAWSTLRLLATVSASLSVGSALLLVVFLLFTRTVSTNRPLLLMGCFAIVASHLAIAIGSHGSSGGVGLGCLVEGYVILLFGTNALLYALCIAVNTYRSLVLFRPAKSHVVYHALAWLGALAVFLCALLIPGDHRIVLLWSGWCFVNPSADVHMAFVIVVLGVIAFNLVMAVVIIRTVHRNFREYNAAARVEARLIILIVLSFGLPFMFHAGLYINQLAAPTQPQLWLFFADACLSYSGGFLLAVMLLGNRAAVRECIVIGRRCGRGRGRLVDEGEGEGEGEPYHAVSAGD